MKIADIFCRYFQTIPIIMFARLNNNGIELNYLNTKDLHLNAIKMSKPDDFTLDSVI